MIEGMKQTMTIGDALRYARSKHRDLIQIDTIPIKNIAICILDIRTRFVKNKIKQGEKMLVVVNESFVSSIPAEPTPHEYAEALLKGKRILMQKFDMIFRIRLDNVPKIFWVKGEYYFKEVIEKLKYFYKDHSDIRECENCLEMTFTHR